jgi:TfoX/Sxy family transcriptional regulator of competence genes
VPRSLELLEEICAGLPYTAKKMFGGHGFFAPNGGMFAAIVSDDDIVLKLVGDEREALIALGGHPWTYHGRDRPMTMRDWIVVPDSFRDDDELFREWARRAHARVPAKTAAPRKGRGRSR